jgi:hypothetical protein
MKEICMKLQRQIEKKEINGVEFFVTVSPYMFPRSLRSSYNDEKGVLTIYFEYLNSELAQEVAGQDGMIKMFAGAQTGRPEYLEIAVDDHDLDEVELTVSDETPEFLKSLDWEKLWRQDKLPTDSSIGLLSNAIKAYGSDLASVVPDRGDRGRSPLACPAGS